VIAFIGLCYASLYLLIFNRLGLLKKTAGNIFAFAGVGVVIVGAIVFAWYTFSPMSSDARLFRFIVPIVPNVSGQVIEVPIQGGEEALSRGDVLFRIDPEPYEYVVRQLAAQVQRFEAERRLAEINVDRARKLVATQAAARVDLDLWTANLDMAVAQIDSTQAQLDDARWKLNETVVRAPADGYVLNLQLRPGSYVTSIPMASSMAFVSTEDSSVVASFSQSSIRKIGAGNEVEVTFNHDPGQVFPGKIERVVGLSGQSQLSASSTLPTFTGAPVSDRWPVIVMLDDEQAMRAMSQGSGGTMVVYTDSGKPFHVISKVAIRLVAWLNYLTSP
jgi:multidrug resistance efflux pump